jgi:hypothetical protein
LIPFEKVQTVYSRSILQRGVGEALLLTVKIKQNGKVYENGSRQIIKSINDGKVRFCSGLVVSKEDGRVRQGDVVTTYKSQGASKLDMIRFEDNQSLRAMADQEDLHVGFTRHRATAKMFVESIDVLRETAGRSQKGEPAAIRLATTERRPCLKRSPEQRRFGTGRLLRLKIPISISTSHSGKSIADRISSSIDHVRIRWQNR